MELVKPFIQDPFQPRMLSAPPTGLTGERIDYIERVIRISSSDSKFAEKAAAAMRYILTARATTPPIITSLNPISAVLGSPSFTLEVNGTGFDAESHIVWNGGAEPTVFVSSTKLTTGVDMSTAQVAIDIAVQVVNSLGMISNTMIFKLLP